MFPTQIREILATLHRHEVIFTIVGGVAAQLQGAPISTFDVDILYSLDDDNIGRLQAALDELEAEFRADMMNRRIKPNLTHLRSLGHKLLRTKFGQLDALGTIEEATTYADVVAHFKLLDVGGFSVQVLELARLIEVKRKAGRPKDLAVLPILEATLARTARS